VFAFRIREVNRRRRRRRPGRLY